MADGSLWWWLRGRRADDTPESEARESSALVPRLTRASYFRKRTLTGGRPPVGGPSGLSGHGQSRRMDGAAQILSL
jgi:hypothetical protein